MADDVETVLKFVLERSEELGIHQESWGDSEKFFTDLLTHRFTWKDSAIIA